MLKMDLQRRGVHYTQAALRAVDPAVHQLGGTHVFGVRDGRYIADNGGKPVRRPEAFILRDGSSVITNPTPLDQHPYIIDVVDGRLAIMDADQAVEEISYWEKPAYYDKFTRSGVLMQNVISARPQRLYLVPNRYCHFWTKKEGCRFCDIVVNLKDQRESFNMPVTLNPEDVADTIREALKEPGRATAICLTGGTNFHGDHEFDAEVHLYIAIVKALGEGFSTSRFPCQIVCTAMPRHQVERLYNETGASSLTMNIEVLNEKLFNWICPGKARRVGYREWKKRLVDAVDVFGRSRVNTGIVSGVELVPPHGFTTEQEALGAVLKEAEEFAAEGVSTVNIIWNPRPGSYFEHEENASLEYYVRLAWGLQSIRQKYGLNIDFDDYRRCGNHPDSDLARVFLPGDEHGVPMGYL
jgi:hypothetical protein